MAAYRTRLKANEIKPRFQQLKRDSLTIEPKLAARINEIGMTLLRYKNELLDKKRFLIEFLNEFYYDIQTYIYDIKPTLNLRAEEIEQFCQQNHLSMTEYYWYSVILPNWLSKKDPKFSYWIEKLLQEEYTATDEALILALTQQINSRSNASASHRYILDLSMATDLLVSHIPSQIDPIFVQLTSIPLLRDGQRNPDFLTKQQLWNNTLLLWGIQRALLVAHYLPMNHPEGLVKLTDAILKESIARPASFVAFVPFPK